MLAEKFNFEGHLATFGARNGPKSSSVYTENISQILPKLISRSPEYEFLTSNWPKHVCQFGKKVHLLCLFSIYEPYFWLVGIEKKILQIAKGILKKKKTPIFFAKK